jgi:hypothetical protein
MMMTTKDIVNQKNLTHEKKRMFIYRTWSATIMLEKRLGNECPARGRRRANAEEAK